MLQFDKSISTNSNAVYPEVTASIGTTQLILDFTQSYDKSTTSGVIANLINTVGPLNPWLVFQISGSSVPSPSGQYNVSIYEKTGSIAYTWIAANITWTAANFEWISGSSNAYGNLLSTERAFVSGSNGYNIIQYLSPTNGGTYTTYNHP